MSNKRFIEIIAAIDEINQTDPNSISLDGKPHPKELLYSQRMTICLEHYWPDADQSLQIAVRAQHIKRWSIARQQYPEGKAGYYAWRKALGLFHAELTKELMIAHHYTEEEAEETAKIIRKEQLKTNPNSQTLEDVACLVFLQHYLEVFAEKHNEEKLIRILQKTWRKMSNKAQEIALALNLSKPLINLINKALG